jgi:hypothetical protein
MKISNAQRRVLENLRDGRKAHHHCRNRSDWGGLTGTITSLHRHGLLDSDGNISAAGLDALSPPTSGKGMEIEKPPLVKTTDHD